MTPGIANNPISIARFFVGLPADNAHDVVDHHMPKLGIFDPTTRVLNDGFCIDSSGNRTTGIDLTLQLVDDSRRIRQETVGSIFGNRRVLFRFIKAVIKHTQ